LDLYLRHDSPGPDKESNWLPTPDAPFVLALRNYWPGQAALDCNWTPPLVMRMIKLQKRNRVKYLSDHKETRNE